MFSKPWISLYIISNNFFLAWYGTYCGSYGEHYSPIKNLENSLKVNYFCWFPHWFKNIKIPFSITSSLDNFLFEPKSFDNARLLISLESMICKLWLNCERYFFMWTELIFAADDEESCLNNENTLIIGNCDLKADIFYILKSSTLPTHVK